MVKDEEERSALGSQRGAVARPPDEVRALEQELAEARRALADRDDLAALGRTAGAFAHELNNPTFAITMAADLLGVLAHRLEPPLRRALEGHAELIADQAQSIASMTRAMLDLTRPAQLDPRPVELAGWLTTTATELAHTHDHPVLATGPAHAVVVTDVSRLREALEPLVLNAVEAGPDRAPVLLRLSADGCGFALDVIDRGGGVAAEVRDDLLEPFISTRGGRGSGLGLARARRFARDLGGSLDLHETGEDGTTMRLWLPVELGRRHAEGAAGGPSVGPCPEAPTGRVVLLDDTEAVRVTVGALLRRSGFTVETVAAADGAERCLEAGPVDLLITDLHFAVDLSLAELLDRLELLQADVRERTVVITGDVPAAVPPLGIARVLSKPFGRAELETAVADVLG